MPPSICVFRDLFAIQDRSAVPGLMNLEEKLTVAALWDVRLIFVCNRFAILLTIYFPTFCCCRVTGDVMPDCYFFLCGENFTSSSTIARTLTHQIVGYVNWFYFFLRSLTLYSYQLLCPAFTVNIAIYVM